MNTLKAQFTEMLNRNIMPLFEIEMSDGEYLIVDIQVVEKEGRRGYNGVQFSFDQDNKETSFDGDVVKRGDGVYVIKYDPYFEQSLDGYLEIIMDNITEGFLLPNDLFKMD
jgi:hypothetical protein